VPIGGSGRGRPRAQTTLRRHQRLDGARLWELNGSRDPPPVAARRGQTP